MIENIDEMQAGPELDALVAERVMGWWATKDECSPTGTWPYRPISDPELYGSFCPSRSIAAAWEVVEKLGPYFSVEQYPGGRAWAAHFKTSYGTGAYAPTAPLAICRAALKAVSNSPAPITGE